MNQLHYYDWIRSNYFIFYQWYYKINNNIRLKIYRIVTPFICFCSSIINVTYIIIITFRENKKRKNTIFIY